MEHYYSVGSYERNKCEKSEVFLLQILFMQGAKEETWLISSFYNIYALSSILYQLLID